MYNHAYNYVDLLMVLLVNNILQQLHMYIFS